MMPLPPIDPIRLARETCRESFAAFTRYFWSTVPGAGRLIWNWHIGVYCQELQAIAERVFAGQPRKYDLVTNVPFGTSKSTVFSILFPNWTWTRMPHARHITATHTQGLVSDFSYKSRQVLQSDRFRLLYPEIVLDRDSGDAYSNTQGGERRCVTVGGKTPMGFHAHFLGIDDPLDPQGARSELELETAGRFVSEVMPSRVVDKQVSVTTLVMQRLHYRDPSAVMLRVGQQEGAVPVRRICLPGELSSDVCPPELAAQYVDGLLDPRRLPRSELRRYQVTLGAYGYSAQVQQNPHPPGGGLFKLQYFSKRCKAAPMHAKRVRFWDRASSAGGGCYTAGVLVARDADSNWYVEHVERGQWEPVERNSRILAMARRDRTKYGERYQPQIVIEDEGGSTSKDANMMLAKVLSGFSVRFEHPTGSKDVRAEPWSAQLAAGNVWMVEDGKWDLNAFIEEHCLFKPEVGKRVGGLVDQVDAAAAAFSWLLGSSATSGVMRILSERGSKTGLRILALTHDELAQVIVDEPALLIDTVEPYNSTGEGGIPLTSQGGNGFVSPSPHGLDRLLGTLVLQVAPIDPADHQGRWSDPVQPWGMLPEELILDRDDGKRLWAFLTKRREPPAIVWVFSGELALTIAQGVCDTVGLARTAIYCPSQDEATVLGKPKLGYVYDLVKATRSMVI